MRPQLRAGPLWRGALHRRLSPQPRLIRLEQDRPTGLKPALPQLPGGDRVSDQAPYRQGFSMGVRRTSASRSSIMPPHRHQCGLPRGEHQDLPAAACHKPTVYRNSGVAELTASILRCRYQENQPRYLFCRSGRRQSRPPTIWRQSFDPHEHAIAPS
jgi:hypothetical protein